MNGNGNGAGKGMSYRDAGVDIDAGNALVEAIKPLVKATSRPGADAEIGGFGGLFDLKAAGFKDPLLVAANDGVGTKVKIAAESGLHDAVGIDLVAMCVNDLIVQGAEPLFFLDYFAVGRLDPEAGARIVAGIAKGCRIAGCALIGGETAEMPGIYREGEYDLAGFSVGAVERGALLPRPDIGIGDTVIAIASSGLHSNGFSLVRRVVAAQGLSWDRPCPFAFDISLGRAVMEPTRIYVKPLLRALRESGGIRALAHITGGGLEENIPRVLPGHLAAEIELPRIQVPPVFGWLAAAGAISQHEMLRTFNCGVGMVAVCERGAAEGLIALLREEGEKAVEIGRIVEAGGSGGRVRFVGELGLGG